MKIKKLIYWFLPVAALMLQMVLFNIIDLMLNSKQPAAVADALEDFALLIWSIFFVMIGYIVALIYKNVGFKGIVLVYTILFFFALEVFVDTKAVINYDFTTNTIWFFIIRCIKRIIMWNSYPVILSVLLHWYSKRIVYPED